MRSRVIASVIVSITVLALSACGANQPEANNLQKNTVKGAELPVVMEASKPENTSVDMDKADVATDQQSQLAAEAETRPLDANNEMIKQVDESIAESAEEVSVAKDGIAQQKQPASPEPKS